MVTRGKLGPQPLPSKDPWIAAVNQPTGHQGSLDVLKMCFRYLGKFVDTFFQCPYGVGASRGQWDMSGTASTHGTVLFGSPGQSTTSGLHPADSEVEEAGNVRTRACVDYKLENEVPWEPGNQANENQVAHGTTAEPPRARKSWGS